MVSPADIIVTSPDSSEITLIAETKLAVKGLQEAESQLKRYMIDVGCSVGLLVTPDKLRIYKDQYISSSPDSVSLVGEFDVSRILGFHSQEPDITERSFLFEQTVQQWLESLASSLDVSQYEPSLKEALRRHVLPAISGGTVRAGGPRYTPSAT